MKHRIIILQGTQIFKMEKAIDAEQGWLSDCSDSSFDGNEFDSDFDEISSEISEDWYDHDDEYYEDNDEWYEYLYKLFFGDSDSEDESDDEDLKMPDED